MRLFYPELKRELTSKTQKKVFDVTVNEPFLIYNSATNEVSAVSASPDDVIFINVGGTEKQYTGKIQLENENTPAGFITAYSRRNGIPSKTVSSVTYTKELQSLTTINYGFKIYINGTLPGPITDFKNVLESFYEQPFEQLEGTGPEGIHIYNGKEISGFSAIGADDYHQDFYIESYANKIVLAHDGKPQSLNNGLYYILAKLGFIFGHMNPEWVVKPLSISGFTETARKIPAVRNRGKFGTGGWGGGIVNVETWENRQQQAVEKQDARNFWNNDDFSDPGHALTFLYEAGQTVDQLAELAIQPIRNILANNPNAAGDDFPYNLGAGAPDGFGFTQEGAEYFYRVANRMAAKLAEIESSEKIRRNDPNFRIRTFIDKDAYGDGVYAPAPPNFPLHKNVYMRLIPYAFQKAYATALDMYTAWNARKLQDGFKGFGIYDYWAISQWAIGRPHQWYRQLFNVKDWTDWGIESVNIESTHGINVSVHHWVASRLMTYWSVKDVIELYDEYFEKVFESIEPETEGNAGGAGHYMKRLFLGWAGYYENEKSIPGALWDCWMAYNCAKKDDTKKRCLDVAAYVHWLILFNRANDSQDSYTEFVNYTYRVYNRQLVHTYPIIFYYFNSPHNKPSTNSFVHYGTAQLMELFLNNLKADLAAFPMVGGIETFTFDIKKARPHPAKPQGTAGVWGNFWQMSPPESGEYPMDIASTSLEAIFRVTDNEFMNEQTGVTAVVANPRYPENWQVWNPTNPHFYKDKTYYISFGTYYNADYSYQWSNMRFNRNAVYFKGMGAESFPNLWFVDWYFYVPKSCKELLYEDSFGPGTNGLGYMGYRKEHDIKGYLVLIGSNITIKRLDRSGIEKNCISLPGGGKISAGFNIPEDGNYEVSYWVLKTYDPNFGQDHSLLIDDEEKYFGTGDRTEAGWEFVTMTLPLLKTNKSISFSKPSNRALNYITDIKITDATGENYVYNGDMEIMERPLLLNEERLLNEYVNSTGDKIINVAPSRYKIYVPPVARGKVWRARFGTPFFRLLNIENLASPVPFEYSE